MNYIINRLKERSTWLGIISLATGIGLSVNPAWVEAIIAAGVGLAGLVSIATPDTETSTESTTNDSQ
ncbi:MAG: hypothetical protein R3Y56_10770 [Akkermansia sp.]